jgi:CMP-N-acetylneuraminic acid synthetase
MKVVAIIPARGGSKGVPRKNLQTIGGVPLVAYAIRAALAAESVDAVYVSTEDDEIAKVAAEHGARVIHRPSELAADTVHTAPVIMHAIRTLKGCPLETVVGIECTAPLVTSEDIDAAVAKMRDGVDVVTTACRDNRFQFRQVPGGIEWLSHNRADEDCRRQDLAPAYRLAGGVYAWRPDALLWMGTAFYGHVDFVEIPEERDVDINTPTDLAIARAIIEGRAEGVCNY